VGVRRFLQQTLQRIEIAEDIADDKNPSILVKVRP
jgi:hypothetical protein